MTRGRAGVRARVARSGGWLAAALWIAAAGCRGGATAREALAARSEAVDSMVVARLLAANPVRADQEFLPALLTSSDEFSAHVLQFRTGEPRHVHRTHDLTIFVHRGVGEVTVDDRPRPARPGDVFHIPRGVPHSIENRGDEPLVTINVFTPPYDGRDNLPAPRGATSRERE